MLHRVRSFILALHLLPRYMMFIKYAAVQLQQLGLKKQMDLLTCQEGQPAAAAITSADSAAADKKEQQVMLEGLWHTT